MVAPADPNAAPTVDPNAVPPFVAAGPPVPPVPPAPPARRRVLRWVVILGVVVLGVLVRFGISSFSDSLTGSPTTASSGQCLDGASETSKIVLCGDPSARYMVVQVFQNEVSLDVCTGVEGADTAYSLHDASSSVVLCLSTK